MTVESLARDDEWIEEYLDVVEEIVGDKREEILTHMEEELPNECVGLLWMGGEIQRLLNQARSPSRFSISQPQLAEKLAQMEASNVLVCVYHSHPGGETNLSWDDKRSLKRQWDQGIVVPWLVVGKDKGTLWYLVTDAEPVFVSRSLDWMRAND